MAYIQPMGTIELMKDVPLTPDYKHTYWFWTETMQFNYFTSKRLIQLNNQMYTRVSDGVCRVAGEAELLKECNYMRFNNHLPDVEGTKNYYAFITNVEYINHNVTEISFIIDELQTWMFQTNFKACFIERQHSETDNVGDNIVPEPFDCGEYVVNGVHPLFNLANYCYVLLVGTYTVPSNAVSSALYTQNQFSGLYSGAKYLVFDNANDVRDFMNAQEFSDGLIKSFLAPIQGSSAINDFWTPISLFAFPKDLVNATASIPFNHGSAKLVSEDAFNTTAPNVSLPSNLGMVGDTYTDVKNNKLFTYPYCFFRVETPGDSRDFKFENTSTPNTYGLTATVNPNPCIKIYLQGYGGSDGVFDNCMLIENFPNLNLYESGVFAGAGNILGNAIKGSILAAISMGMSGSAGSVQTPSTTEVATLSDSNIYGKVPGGVVPKPNNVEPNYDFPNVSWVSDMAKPISAYGSITKGGNTSNIAADIANRMLFVNVYTMTIKKEAAERFDSYLSKYGYAQNRVDVPNVHCRARWTYIKTRGCLVTGQMPTSSRLTIQNALDSGITYWVYGSAEIGDYDLDNGVLNG